MCKHLLFVAIAAFTLNLKAASTVTLSADNTGSMDVTSDINNAISQAGTNGTLIIPEGTYKVTGRSGGNSTGCGQNVVTNLPAGITIKPEGHVTFTNGQSSGAYMWSTYNDGVSITNGETAGASFPTTGDDHSIATNPDGKGSGYFEYKGLGGFCVYASSNPGKVVRNETFVGNYIHDLSYQHAHGMLVSGIVDGLTLQHNAFHRIWNGGYENYSFNKGCSSGECNWDGTGFELQGGTANADISYNWISYTGNDGFHAWFDIAMGKTYRYICNHLHVHNNQLDHIKRIGIEIQGQSSACVGGCDGYTPGDDFQFYSNFDHDHAWPGVASYCFSINTHYTSTHIFNNTCAQPASEQQVYAHLGDAYETDIVTNGDFISGNIAASDDQPGSATGWGAYWSDGNSGYGVGIGVTNNVICGPKATEMQHMCDNTGCRNTNFIGSDGGQDVNGYPNFSFTSNYQSESCWATGALSTSHIMVGFSSPDNQGFSSGGNGTWNAYVKSALSIDRVSFYVDDNSAPVVVQSIQDKSGTFVADLKWLYHATLNTGAYAKGTHTLKMVALDVSGQTASATQSFTVGSSSQIALLAPTGVKSSAASSSQINVSWNPVLGATSYKLYKAFSSNGPGVLISSDISSTNYKITGLTPQVTYYLYATAVSKIGESGQSARSMTKTPSSGTAPAFDDGYLTNGNFGGTTASTDGWSWYSTGSFSVTTDSSSQAYSGNSLLAKISTIGTINTQIYQQPISLPAGRTMVLTFYAKASAARTLNLNLIKSTSPFTNYGINQKSVTLLTNWKQYTVTFTSPSAAVSDARLQFLLNSFSSGDTFELDNVSITAQ
jgi:hypothetical protein